MDSDPDSRWYAGGASRRILLMEPDPELQSFLAYLLRYDGHDVLVETEDHSDPWLHGAEQVDLVVARDAAATDSCLLRRCAPRYRAGPPVILLSDEEASACGVAPEARNAALVPLPVSPSRLRKAIRDLAR